MNIMIKFGISILFILVFSYSTFAQNLFSFNDLIQNSIQDTSLYLFNKEIDYLKNNPFTIPLLEEMEFRTNTDEWDLRRQQYTFRTRFNGWKRSL